MKGRECLLTRTHGTERGLKTDQTNLRRRCDWPTVRWIPTSQVLTIFRTPNHSLRHYREGSRWRSTGRMSQDQLSTRDASGTLPGSVCPRPTDALGATRHQTVPTGAKVCCHRRGGWSSKVAIRLCPETTCGSPYATRRGSVALRTSATIALSAGRLMMKCSIDHSAERPPPFGKSPLTMTTGRDAQEARQYPHCVSGLMCELQAAKDVPSHVRMERCSC